MEARKLSEIVVAAAIGAVLPIVGAVYFLGGRMAELDRLRDQVTELRGDLRATRAELEAVRAEGQGLQTELRAEVRDTLAQALQDIDRQLSAAPVLAMPSGNSVLTDQARTRQELEQIEQWGQHQQRWIEDMSTRIGEMLDSISSGQFAPAAGAPDAER